MKRTMIVMVVAMMLAGPLAAGKVPVQGRSGRRIEPPAPREMGGVADRVPGPAGRLDGDRPRREAHLGQRVRHERPGGGDPGHAEDPLSHRLHHQALHEHGAPAAARRREARARRSGREVRPRFQGRGPLPGRSADHRPAPPDAHVGASGRSGVPLLDRPRFPDHRSHPRGPSLPGEAVRHGDEVPVLEPGPGHRRPGRGSGFGRAVRDLRHETHPRAPGDGGHLRPQPARGTTRRARRRLRAAPAGRDAPRPPVHGFQRADRGGQHLLDRRGPRPFRRLPSRRRGRTAEAGSSS